jgi:hypothetical protein
VKQQCFTFFHLGGYSLQFLSIDSLKIKLRAAFLHFCLSGLVAAIAAYLVFYIWFPYPFDEVSDGKGLFWLVFWVDLCCGPLLTFVLVNSKKTRNALFVDLSLVTVIQLAALFYGLYTVMLAKPMFLVFEVDRFHVVAFTDVDRSKLHLARAEYQSVKILGPSVIAVKVPAPGDDDYFESIALTSKGLRVSYRPQLWVPYIDQKDKVLAHARSLAELKLADQSSVARLKAGVQETGSDESELRYLPMQSRTVADWIVLINKETAEIVGFANVDGF